MACAAGVLAYAAVFADTAAAVEEPHRGVDMTRPVKLS
nr:hypothetical protein asmbl_26 [uncultured bacterium]